MRFLKTLLTVVPLFGIFLGVMSGLFLCLGKDMPQYYVPVFAGWLLAGICFGLFNYTSKDNLT